MIKTIFCIGLLLGLHVLVFMNPVWADVTMEDFSLTIEATKTELKTGEKLDIKCTFRNVSDGQIVLPYAERMLGIIFKTADDKRLPGVARGGSSSHYMGIERIELDPGEAYEYEIAGDIIEATRKVYIKKGKASEEVTGVFIDLPNQDPVYAGSSKLKIHAEYDLYAAIDWSRPINLDGAPRKSTNPNTVVKKVEKVSAGLTVTEGIVVSDPIMLKSNSMYINITQ